LDYNEIIEYINSIERFGSRPGLIRLQNLLERLKNPEKSLKVIHIAGTNGKGSVATMLEFILMKAGYRVGMYTSPHLESYNERIKINNINISDEDFAKVGEKIITASKKCKEEEHPTVFESLTAMALLYFAESEVDFVILEVGLGGRYDATNVIENPLVSVITSIGMDHMDVLGDNIESIAHEKAGIIKKNCNTVLYFPNTKVYNIIKDICKELDSTLFYAYKTNIKDKSFTIERTRFSIETEFYSYDNLEFSFLGEHQIYNAATALLTIEVLKKQGIVICEKDIRDGLRESFWPGRMEIVSTMPLVIFDGAHNEGGAIALKKAFKQYFKDRKITLLIGILKDKPYKNILEQIMPQVGDVIITEPSNSRKLSVDELEEAMKKYPNSVYKNKNIQEAFELALSLTSKEDILCCAGSLYLISELKNILKRKRG